MGIVFDQIPVKDPDLVRVQLAVANAFAAVPSVPAPNVVTVTADYKVKGTEDALHVDASAGPVRITMQSPSKSNRLLTIKQVNLQSPLAKVNPVTLMSADGSKTIAGQAAFAIDMSGVGSVNITADDQQHWPAVDSGGNPSVAPAGGLVYIGIPPIYVSGNVISFKGGPTPPPAPPAVVPWVAPVPYGNQNTFISNSLGTEAWAAECMVDFAGAPSSVTMYFWYEAQDTASNGIVRIRIGGTSYKDITGTVAVSTLASSTTMTPGSVAIPIATPNGQNRITLTLQSTNTNKTTATGANLLFR